MDLKGFIEATSPEVLEKLAEDAQDELLNKLEARLMPLLEKTAQYTAYILKCAGEELQEGEQVIEVPSIVNKPETGNKDNQEVVNKNQDDTLDKNMIVESIDQAIEAGKPDAIIPFVKSLMQSRPDAVNEVVKIIKVELQDLVAKAKIDENSALEISNALNQLLGE